MLLSGRFKWAVLVSICVIVLRCIDTANPFKAFTSDELVGTWQAKYENFWNFSKEITGVETIILRADGTYQQIYDDGKGYKYVSPWNKWRLERGRDLYLEGGRFYALGIEDAKAYARGGILDVIAPGNERMELMREIVLFVGPTSLAPGGAVLFSPPISDLDAPKFAKFYRVLTFTSTPPLNCESACSKLENQERVGNCK